EEIGELYAHKNGLAVENSNGVMVAEQIGQIFGEQMSKGKDSDSEYTGNIIVNNSIKNVKVDGTEAVVATVVITGAVVVVGGVVYYCSNPEEAMKLGAVIEAEIARDVEFWKNVGAKGVDAIVNIYKASKQSKKSQKERATNVPSWTHQKPPKKDENKKAYLERILNEKYGKGGWDKGPGSEYNKIKKALDRGGLWPNSF
ncbi:MAG: hypothetical protein LBV03_05940, partial [Fusobacteriales bacterium]|nr:hypothetical protein [Fusobacteriales bacterium]